MDDEITVSYVSVFQPAAARWQELGFECNCDACYEQVSNRDQFDEREAWIQEVAAGLSTLRAYRAEYAGQTAGLTAEIARTISRDPETKGMLRLCTDVIELLNEKADVISSEIATAYETSYHTRQAFHVTNGDAADSHTVDLKRCELSILARCFGLAHPRTKEAWRELQRVDGSKSEYVVVTLAEMGL